MGLLKNVAMKLLFGKVEGKMPKMIDGHTHGIIDYAEATMFLSAGCLFWRQDRKAAVVSLAAGVFLLGESLLTDYPMGAKPVISFPVHGKLDRGFVGFTAAAPNTFEFKSTAAIQFFRMNSVASGLVVSLTDFNHPYAKLAAGERDASEKNAMSSLRTGSRATSAA